MKYSFGLQAQPQQHQRSKRMKSTCFLLLLLAWSGSSEDSIQYAAAQENQQATQQRNAADHLASSPPQNDIGTGHPPVTNSETYQQQQQQQQQQPPQPDPHLPQDTPAHAVHPQDKITGHYAQQQQEQQGSSDDSLPTGESQQQPESINSEPKAQQQQPPPGRPFIEQYFSPKSVPPPPPPQVDPEAGLNLDQLPPELPAASPNGVNFQNRQSPQREEEEQQQSTMNYPHDIYLSTSQFTTDQLRRLLKSLEDLSNNEDENRTTVKDDDILDDRTYLDIFGERAKEVLTQKVIPPTDKECRWDWRSLQCEPACECEFRSQLGDYHLGRSCRLRPQQARAGLCRSIDPALLAQETTLATRIKWLLQRTWKGASAQSQRKLERLIVDSALKIARFQTSVCAELWDKLYHEDLQQRSCWPADRVPIATLPERILCGPIQFPVCQDEQTDDKIDPAVPRNSYAAAS